MKRIIFILLLTISGAMANWPEFRGSNASGIADNEKPPIHLDVKSNLVWRVGMPAGLSSPVIWEDRIFLTAFDNDELKTICVDRKSGKVLWAKTAPAKQIEAYFKPDGSPAASTPATDGKLVYSFFGSCGVIAYDFAGNEKWKYEIPVAEHIGDFGTGTSPILADGLLLLNLDQAANSHLLALDAQTGKKVWKAEREGFRSSWSTPIIWETEGRKEVVLPGGLQLKSYDLRTGKDLWTVQGLPSAMCTAPVIGDNLLFVTGWAAATSDTRFPTYESMLAEADDNKDGLLQLTEARNGMMRGWLPPADTNKDRKVTPEEWQALLTMAAKSKHAFMAIKPGGKGDVTGTHIAWEGKRGQPYVPSPLFYKGNVYLVRDGGQISSFRAKDGHENYLQERLGTRGSYFSSPIAADNKIYTISAEGVVVIVEAGEKLNVISRFPLEERTLTTPAIKDNTLYIRTAKHLYAFGEKQKD